MYRCRLVFLAVAIVLLRGPGILPITHENLPTAIAYMVDCWAVSTNLLCPVDQTTDQSRSMMTVGQIDDF